MQWNLPECVKIASDSLQIADAGIYIGPIDC